MNCQSVVERGKNKKGLELNTIEFQAYLMYSGWEYFTLNPFFIDLPSLNAIILYQ